MTASAGMSSSAVTTSDARGQLPARPGQYSKSEREAREIRVLHAGAASGTKLLARQIENAPGAQLPFFGLGQGDQRALCGNRDPARHDGCVTPAQEDRLTAGKPARIDGTHSQRRQ